MGCFKEVRKYKKNDHGTNTEKEGNYDDVLSDFDKLKPEKVGPLTNSRLNGKVGKLKDGSIIVVRDGSSQNSGGHPTLERQYPNSRKKDKI